MTLDAAEVRRLLVLDQESGRLINRVTRRKSKAGCEAGGLCRDGYRRVRLGGSKIPAHRIVWLLTHGTWPDCDIDHVNGCKADNRPQNLRLASRAENMRNTGLRTDNTSGVKGVYRGSSGGWIAQLNIDGKTSYFGTHPDIDLAGLIVSEARRRFHGDFARQQ